MDFFESLEQGMDQKLAGYVSNAAANLCAVIAPVVATGLVIYVMLIGYAIIRGEAQDSLHSAMWRAVKWSLISAVALSAGGFNTYIVGGLNGIESSLFQAATGSASGGQLLDICLAQYINLFNLLDQNLNAGGITPIPNLGVVVAILFLGVGSLIFFGLAACVFMLAMVAEVLVIALGPAFIATLIFPPIQRFADAWLSAALNTVIIKVLAGIVLTISTTFLQGLVEEVSGSFNATSVAMDCLKILLLSVSFGAIFGYLPMLSAQLVGGAPLPHVTMPRFSRGGGRRSMGSKASSSNTGGSLQPSRNLPYTSRTPAYRANSIGNLNR